MKRTDDDSDAQNSPEEKRKRHVLVSSLLTFMAKLLQTNGFTWVRSFIFGRQLDDTGTSTSELFKASNLRTVVRWPTTETGAT
jgi:hypothetical protein